MRILIVDDEVDHAETLQLLLRAGGHVAIAAYSVEGGKAVAAETRPDAVVLDWLMPLGGGRAFLEWLRSRPETLSVPVVVMTGWPLDDLDVPAGPGVVTLQKPCPVARLFAALGIEVTL